MSFINTKEIEKELEALNKYFLTRKLSFGEVGMLLSNYMSFAQQQVQKDMLKKQNNGKS